MTQSDVEMELRFNANEYHACRVYKRDGDILNFSQTLLDLKSCTILPKIQTENVSVLDKIYLSFDISQFCCKRNLYADSYSWEKCVLQNIAKFDVKFSGQ